MRVWEGAEPYTAGHSAPHPPRRAHKGDTMTHDQHHQDPDYKDPLRDLHPSTAVIYAGYRARLSEAKNAVKPPVFRTSTFEFSRATEGAKFFQRAYHLPDDDGQVPGLVYSRLNNPNTEIFEDKMVALEANATRVAAFPSGTSAITTAILALVPQGGRILYSNPVYGGTISSSPICARSVAASRPSVWTQATSRTQKSCSGPTAPLIWCSSKPRRIRRSA
jgi:cystathionine beta-lyase/cystathionine gamma-synthase